MWQLSPIFRTLMRRKFGVFLLVIQIAFTLTIFSNLAFLTWQMNLVVTQPSGVDDERLFTITLRSLRSLISYADAQRDMENLRRLPGVERVALTHWVPMGGMAFTKNLRINPEKDAPTTIANVSDISPDILPTLGLKLNAGRDFSEMDMAVQTAGSEREAKTIIITRILADSLFGKGEHAVGKLVYCDDEVYEIIGVTDNWLGFTIPFNERAETTVFHPRYDETQTEHRYLVRVNSAEQRANIIDTVSQTLRRNYDNQLLSWIDTLDGIKAINSRQNLVAVNLFIVLMLALSFVIAFAISGQTLFWITQRTKQIGIHRALGASRRDIIAQLLLENALICGLGLAIGILLSLTLNQIIVAALSVLPMPPWFLLAICLVLLALCLASAAVPAWRASRVPPSIATRNV